MTNTIAASNTGWMGNGEGSRWNSGVITEGTLPAREAFETAGALFTVEKRELLLPVPIANDPWTLGQAHDYNPTGTYGVVRTDTNALLGVVSKQYECVQNEALLRMAEFIREEAEMDSVVLLKHGEKVCFTANLRGASADVVPGDTINRRLVGYLGHDGKTGCGAIFTNVRVVCQNTLVAALKSDNKLSIWHKTGATENFDRLIQSIDASRQTFNEEMDVMRELAATPINADTFRELLERVYVKEIPEGKQIEDLRKHRHLVHAYHDGLGARSFAPYTLWSAVNAITQIETSTLTGTRAQRNRAFARSNFGAGYSISQRAIEEARELITC